MQDYPAFAVAPVCGGRLCLSIAQRKTIDAYLRRAEGKSVRVSFSQPGKARSTNQNRYYWGVPLTMIAAETGHSTEEVHEFLKAMFLPRSYLQIGKKIEQITKSTTTLSTHDMEEYLDRVRAFAAVELGIGIPLPNEL